MKETTPKPGWGNGRADVRARSIPGRQVVAVGNDMSGAHLNPCGTFICFDTEFFVTD
jgi:hypothetical protein